MEKVNELVKEIKSNLSQTSASQKDEVRVMKAMLNDREYKATIYDKNGPQGTYCPAEDVRNMIGNVITKTTKMAGPEAEKLASNYEFNRSDAETMVGVSKEFVNTYVQTGRKLPFGGREKSDVSISHKQVDAGTRRYPKQVGIGADGKPIYENGEVFVQAYEGIKAYSPCPKWIYSNQK